MDAINPSSPGPEELPADPGTQKALRRGLLALSLVSLLAPCGLCWYSTSVERMELLLIPSTLGLVVVLYSLYTFYRREQKQDLAPPLGRVILAFCLLAAAVGLTLAWLLAAVGWRNGAGAAILVLGAWALFLAGSRIWQAASFARRALREENDQASLEMVSIRGSHPIHPQLSYRYAEVYRGRLQDDRVHRFAAEIREAIAAGKFRYLVLYLPDQPRVHRLQSWRILP